MRREDFDKLRDETYEVIREISRVKGNDYSGNEDALRSFKTNAEALGLTPFQVWGVLTVKHWDAVMTYIRDGKVESEGIHGRINDIILYMFLLKGLVVEHDDAIAGTQ